jgi:hypothetical protein
MMTRDEELIERLLAFAGRLDVVPDDTPDIAYLCVEMTHGEGRNVRDSINALVDRLAALAASPVVGDKGQREQVARIIDPGAWANGSTADHARAFGSVRAAVSRRNSSRAVALAKADAILSSTPVRAESMTRRMMAAQASEAAERGEPYNERDGG